MFVTLTDVFLLRCLVLHFRALGRVVEVVMARAHKSSLQIDFTRKICIFAAQSAIRKRMAQRIAFWVDRHVGPKFTVFVWESNGK